MQNNDSQSSSSSDSEAHYHENVNTQCAALENEVEALFEKRTDVRCIALNKLVQGTTQAICRKFISSHTKDLVRALKTGISLPCSAAEHHLSCRLLQLCAITCPGDWKEYYPEFSSLLRKSVESNNDLEQRADSLRTYGLFTFLFGEAENTVDALNYLQELLQEPREDDDEVTTLDNEHIVDQLLPEMISEIVEYTNSCDPDVKIAAFEAIALFTEAVLQQEGESYSPHYYNGYFDVPEIITLLKDLATGNPRTVAKKHKLRYKQLEPVLKTIEEGISPTETLTLKNQKFTFSTWYEAIQLARFREFLGFGFQVHFLHNDLLSDIFDIAIKGNAPLSLSEKKTMKLNNARQTKERQNWVKKGRSQKQRQTDSW